ncbi:hypothetical protein [Sorangium sp. So ce854]|uniref:hypothetical protein n=1 Tax=Sorangium sp. So ce854 TaxID=3133322 RepID=UPI003F6263A8
MVSGSGLYALAHLFGLGELSTPLMGTGGCGTIEYASLEDAIDGVINGRVWGGMHFRGSSEVGAEAGRQIARYVRRNFLRRL